MDWRSLKQNYNESLAMSLFRNSLFFTFFVCSSCSLCSSCIFPFWGFVVCEVSGGFWAWFQWTLRSRQVVWMILLRMFFVFEGLWRKFFKAFVAWIHIASPICGLLRFLEAFELDSSDLWDLGRWFGWFLFECFSYSLMSSLTRAGLLVSSLTRADVWLVFA